MVEADLYAAVIRIPRQVVEFVNVDAVGLVGDDAVQEPVERCERGWGDMFV